MHNPPYDPPFDPATLTDQALEAAIHLTDTDPDTYVPPYRRRRVEEYRVMLLAEQKRRT